MKPKTAGRVDGDSRFTGHLARAASPFSGLVSDARIFTSDGEFAVQHLRVGDRLITRQGMIPITRIETFSLVTRAVYVIAGSLGHNRPDRDSFLSADQTVLLRDWRARAFGHAQEVLVPAKALIDGEFVRDLGMQPMTLHRIFCDGPQVIYADGMELGSADTLGLLPDQRAA
jgi:hypothetical protein